MSDIDEENVDSTNDTTEEVENTEEVEGNAVDAETEDTPKYTESEMKSYARAKKAEAEARQLKKELEAIKTASNKPVAKVEPSEKQDVQLTQLDVIALSKANIPDDDIEEVIRWAKFNNITVKDALKDKTMTTILRDRAEMRQTAEATNTGNARRGSAKLSDEQVLSNASKGKLPDDPEELAAARMASKLKK